MLENKLESMNASDEKMIINTDMYIILLTFISVIL